MTISGFGLLLIIIGLILWVLMAAGQLGLILVIIGVVVLLFGGVSYRRRL